MLATLAVLGSPVPLEAPAASPLTSLPAIPPTLRNELKQWFTALTSAPRSHVSAHVGARVGEAAAWLHSRRLEFGLPTDMIDMTNPAASIESARAMLCTAQNRAQLSSLDQLVQQALPGAKPLAPALDSGWDCLCSDFVVTAEYTELANAIVGALGDTSSEAGGEAKTQRLVAALRAIIPVVMGEQGLCSGGCKDFVVKIGDWAIGSVSWAAFSPDLAFLPPLSQLEGLPAAAMECVCGGVSWVEFAKLITADGFSDLMGVTDGLPSLGAPASLEDAASAASAISAAFGDGISTSAVTAAVEAALAYPAFLLGRDGFCAGKCANGFKMISSYIQSVAAALLGREASLARVSAAVQALSVDGLHTCTCGGTLDWGALQRGVAGALEAVGSVSLTNLGAAAQLPGQLLGVVFGPAFLCSSPTCKSMVSELMDIATSLLPALGSGDDGGSAADAMAGFEWCPADEASAGYTLRQTFVLDEAEPLTEAKQDAFKQKVVDTLNEGVTGVVKLSAGAVDLVVSSDSVRVEVVMAQPALASEVEAGMTSWASTPPATLSTMLGVAVAAPPTAAERAAIAASKSQPESDGGGDDDDTLLIVAIAAASAAGALLVVAAITCACCVCKKKRAQPAAKSAAQVVVVAPAVGKPVLQGGTSL